MIMYVKQPAWLCGPGVYVKDGVILSDIVRGTGGTISQSTELQIIRSQRDFVEEGNNCSGLSVFIKQFTTIYSELHRTNSDNCTSVPL